MLPLRLLILAGGESDEHEISLLSARSVLAALASRDDLDADLRVVTRQGRCLDGPRSQAALARGHAHDADGAPLPELAIAGAWDVVFPLMHGPFGEDGTLQGMLELAHVPYVGSGVLAASLCMDKAMTKEVLARAGVPQVAWRLVTAAEFAARPLAVVEQLVAQLPGPWFVKPNNLGSSVGIARVEQPAALPAALARALAYGRRAIVEAAVVRPREVEVALLGNDDPEASGVGEITYQAAFYDYETKYTAGRAALHVPAPLSDAAAERLRALARQAFVALDCAGLARVDFLLPPGDEGPLLNEVNTMPGFTPLSMYPRLWGAQGIAYGDLVARLCALAQARHQQSTTAAARGA